MLVEEVCRKYEAEHPGRVMWTFGTGSKMLISPFMVDDDHPMVFDDSTFEVEVSEREKDYED